jgi:hypothetical protein
MRLPSLTWTGRSMTSGLARVVSRGHKARRSEAFCEESGSTGWVIGGAAWIRHMWLCSGAPPHDALPAIPLGRLSCASGSTCNGVNSEHHRSHYPCIYRIHSYVSLASLPNRRNALLRRFQKWALALPLRSFGKQAPCLSCKGLH